MKVVHLGFDTLAIAYQANISTALLASLVEAKSRAEAANETVPFDYGGRDFNLLSYGGRGYSFILQDLPLGATWSFKKPNPKDLWGIRVSVGSDFLATQGLGRVRAYLNDTLAAFGIDLQPNQVSIGRADFCVDILAPDFVLDPEALISHSHSSRADHADYITSAGRSGHYTSVTLGKMPNRQVIIYNKRREVIDKHKPLWWDIWNCSRTKDGLPTLDPRDPASSTVWRVEIRAGKSHLKERWRITTWADFNAKFGDVVAQALEMVRYTVPSAGDSNRSRWPSAPLWDAVRAATEGDLFEMRSYLTPERVKEVHREEQARLLFGQVFGTATTLAAIEGATSEALRASLAAVGRRMSEAVRQDPDRAESKLRAAKERYRFVSEGG